MPSSALFTTRQEKIDDLEREITELRKSRDLARRCQENAETDNAALKEQLGEAKEFLRIIGDRRPPSSKECGYNQNNSVTQAAKSLLTILSDKGGG